MISKEAIRIREMFNSLAGKYDLANDVLSFGMHRVWKSDLVEGIGNSSEKLAVLDCATGTGDIAIQIKKKFPNYEVSAIDFSEKMLEQAPAKAEKAGVKDIQFLAADILKLPFNSNSFDRITISFGIRNVENLLGAIAEFERVLKSGGSLHVLEFGKPPSDVWAKVYTAYNRNILPLIGGILTRNKNAYSYLNKSSEDFASGNDFIKQFPSTSWKPISSKSLMGGIAYIYRIEKI